jgi:hypothetical protein
MQTGLSRGRWLVGVQRFEPPGLPPARHLRLQVGVPRLFSHRAALAARLQCVLEAGELVFIPADWSNGVLNPEDSVGVATRVTTT